MQKVPDPETTFEELSARLRERGCRLTPQRVALLRLLAESRGHPSASHLYEQIHRQFPTTRLATVYKTLALLKDLGEVLELGLSDDDNRYDGSQPKPHPHLICVCCCAIIDPKFSLGQDLDAEASGVAGYQVLGHRLDFYGMCPECQTSESEALLGSGRCATPRVKDSFVWKGETIAG